MARRFCDTPRDAKDTQGVETSGREKRWNSADLRGIGKAKAEHGEAAIRKAREKLRPVRHRLYLKNLKGDLMNDYEYTFKQDSKEKKSIGASARKMNRTGKGPIKFPSDYLTPAQKKKLNGPCNSYDMGKPMSWQDFLKMPEDLQRLYLQGIMDKFHPSQRALAELFGTSKGMIAGKLKEFGIASSGQPRGGKNKNFNEVAWDAWIADGIIPEEIIEDDKLDYIPDEVRAVRQVRKEMQEARETEVVDAYISKLKPMPVKEDKLEETVPLVKIPYNVGISEVKNDNPKESPRSVEDYFYVDFEKVAKMWTTYRDICITPKDVAAMLAIIKLVDISNGHVNDETWKSLAFYAQQACKFL